MSGKTARRARREALHLLDAERVFSDALSRLMPELGIDYDRCTRDEVDLTIRIACEEFEPCWDEFVLWVIHGDDEREKTMDILRAFRGL